MTHDIPISPETYGMCLQMAAYLQDCAKTGQINPDYAAHLSTKGLRYLRADVERATLAEPVQPVAETQEAV